MIYKSPAFSGAVENLLLEASVVARGHFRHPELQIGYKPDKSVLTAADTEVNRLLKAGLKDLLPGAGWLSEEDADSKERLHQKFVWVVDPIDGTKEFVGGIPEFAISVGLVENGQAVFGGVMNPATGEGAVGVVGGGVKTWGTVSQELSSRAFSELSICFSRNEVDLPPLKHIQNYFKNSRPIGSVAYKLMRVAAGMDDIYFSAAPKNEWDICGGVALLKAKGLEYRRLDGGEVIFNQESTRLPGGAIASTPENLDQFMVLKKQLTGR